MSSQSPQSHNLENVHVMLVGPYAPDLQQSMERYAQLLSTGLQGAGLSVSVHRPQKILGRFIKIVGRFRKHLTYLDKFVLFPRRLARTIARRQSSSSLIVHILDQGNAPYLQSTSTAPTLITCHDLIAAKAALLSPDISESASRPLGHWFHSRVVHALQRSHTVVCDSDKTLADCRLLLDASLPVPRLTRVYVPIDPFFREPVGSIPATPPCLIHVGNSAWYKNRPGLFRIYAELCRLLPHAPPLHLYGEPLQSHEQALLEELQLQTRVTCHPRPSNVAIRQAYHQAEALIFPSLQEGFGWPPLEAMACGCPVFTSNRPPLTEVGGGAAEYVDPENPVQAAAHIASRLQLGLPWKERSAAAGRARASEFGMEKFIGEMVSVYQSVIDPPGD